MTIYYICYNFQNNEVNLDGSMDRYQEFFFQYIKKNYTIKEDLTLMVGDSIFDKEYAENCKIDFMFIEEFNAIKN